MTKRKQEEASIEAAAKGKKKHAASSSSAAAAAATAAKNNADDAPARPPKSSKASSKTKAPATTFVDGDCPEEAIPVPVWADGLPEFRNKEKVLILSSRGITHRFRHLMLDLFQLLPHAKKDAKLDTKKDRSVINDVADAAGCSTAVFFEARRKADLYLWLSRPPEGPSAKFLVRNVHTMAELKLAGNHMRGSRPCLSFHGAFDDEARPHWALLKAMLLRAFATPRRHPKSKPFFDHVISFALADGKIWIRNYQVVPGADRKGVLGGGGSGKGAADGVEAAAQATAAQAAATQAGRVRAAVSGMSLVEVGPRACLEPIKIFAGSFGGRVLYDNAEYVSPNTVRSALKRQKAGKYGARVKAQQAKRKHAAANPTPRDELLDVFK